MAKTPVVEQVQVNFRMPVYLRDRIKAAADTNNRSMNAEIVATLEEKYSRVKALNDLLELLTKCDLEELRRDPAAQDLVTILKKQSKDLTELIDRHGKQDDL